MATLMYSDGKGITVEVISLTDVADPSRPGDPHGSGQYLLVRLHGRMMAHLRKPGQLGAWCDQADLHPVDKIIREWHP
jgi:hypothetical protein